MITPEKIDKQIKDLQDKEEEYSEEEYDERLDELEYEKWENER